MGQYRLWLHHRTIDQNLREQQVTHIQELSAINEHIARIENAKPSTTNTIITMLMQQLNSLENTNSGFTDITSIQPERNGAPQENADTKKHQTPPPSNYGLQGDNLQTTNPTLGPRSQHTLPGLLAWSSLPNFTDQELDVPEEPSATPNSIQPATTYHLSPADLHSLQEPHTQTNEQLPWWLRNLMQSPQEEYEPSQPTPQLGSEAYPHPQGDQYVGHWFARRTRLVHYDEGQED